MTIDTSYFEGDLSIGQITSPAVIASVNLFIQKYEEELLTKLLGYPLYTVYKAGIIAEAPEQRFTDLKSGKEYQWNWQTVKWNGLAFTSNGTKRSLIANYVYYRYLKDSVSFTMGAGEVDPKKDVATSPKQKMIQAWNEMVLMNVELYQFLQANLSVYPEYDNSLFTFSLFYSNSRYDFMKPINEFGI
jgi:hypothetical protein